jgi:2Fe-2S iron-sulfur cluster binding domain
MNAPSSTSTIAVAVNGTRRSLDIDHRMSLLDLLRERLGLTGSKKGCDHGQCGACTVLIGGRRANACLALAVAHDGAEITTVEGPADRSTGGKRRRHGRRRGGSRAAPAAGASPSIRRPARTGAAARSASPRQEAQLCRVRNLSQSAGSAEDLRAAPSRKGVV